jgi:hypothetical protein
MSAIAFRNSAFCASRGVHRNAMTARRTITASLLPKGKAARFIVLERAPGRAAGKYRHHPRDRPPDRSRIRSPSGIRRSEQPAERTARSLASVLRTAGLRPSSVLVVYLITPTGESDGRRQDRLPHKAARRNGYQVGRVATVTLLSAIRAARPLHNPAAPTPLDRLPGKTP